MTFRKDEWALSRIDGSYDCWWWSLSVVRTSGLLFCDRTQSFLVGEIPREGLLDNCFPFAGFVFRQFKGSSKCSKVNWGTLNFQESIWAVITDSSQAAPRWKWLGARPKELREEWHRAEAEAKQRQGCVGCAFVVGPSCLFMIGCLRASCLNHKVLTGIDGALSFSLPMLADLAVDHPSLTASLSN